MKTLRTLLTILILISANAAAQTNTISFTNSVIAAGNNNFFDIALNKFNTSLGILDSVTVAVQSSTLGGSFFLDATNPALDIDFEGAFGRVTIRQATTNSLGFTQLGQTTNAVTTTPAPIFTLLGGTSTNFSISPLVVITNTTPNAIQSISSSFWSNYSDPTGSGSVIFQARNNPEITVSGGAYFQSATNFTADTVMSVTYTYVVPEPSTWALLAAGATITGLVAARRRRIS